MSRVCPACGLMIAAEGDRYCADCGSARDRSAWVEGPTMAEDPPASDEETEHYAAVEAADRAARLREFGLSRLDCE